MSNSRLIEKFELKRDELIKRLNEVEDKNPELERKIKLELDDLYYNISFLKRLSLRTKK